MGFVKLSSPLLRRYALNVTRLSGSQPTRIAQRRYMSALATAGIRDLLSVSEEVRDAVATDKPVVALESTIYTHGFMGKDLAREHEELVRSHGGIPAIIALVDGVPKVGVTSEDIVRMIESPDTVKASRRDIAYIAGMVGPTEITTSAR